MKNVVVLSVVFMIPWMLLSCKNDSGANKTRIPQKTEPIDATTEYQHKYTRLQDEGDKELKAIDFFGIKMQGKYDDIVVQIYELPILSLIESRDTITNERKDGISFTHTLEFCGVPCGMTTHCQMNLSDEIYIHNLCFITSQTDKEIIQKFVTELTKYYGEPDISDDREDSYYWYTSRDMCVCARHLRAPNGGWTVYFYYS